MNIKKSSILILVLCILLCSCQQKEKGKFVIDVPAGNSMANSYINSAGIAFEKKDYNSALTDYLEVEKIFLNSESHTNDNELAGIYSMIGRCYVQLSAYHKAKDYFEKSLPISEKLFDDKLNFENYFNLLKINYSIDDGNLELALEYGKKAEKTALDLYGDKSSEMGEVYSNIGKVYCNMGEFDQANKYLQKAIIIMDQLYGQDNENSAVIYEKMAEIYRKQGEYYEAEGYLNKAEEILKKYKNYYWLAVVYSDFGNIYWENEKYENALDYYNKCLEVYEIWGKVDFDLAKYHYWKAGALYNIKSYESSKQEMLLAHKICEDLPVKSELTRTLNLSIKDGLKIYYDYNYDGDKSTGFEIWYEDLISSKMVQ